MKKPQQESISLTLSKHIDVICGQFEAEFRAGKQPKIETFLAGLPKADQPPLFKELLRLELDLAGDELTLSPKDYLRRFPEHATLVNEIIAGAVAASNARDPAHKSTYSVSGSRGAQATDTQNERRKSISPNAEIALPSGSQLGRYRIERELGKGAMGVVYLAEDSQIGRKVALKIPKQAALAQPDALERFYREARMLGTLHHPNICPVYDVGAIDGTHYLTMAWIPGKPLSSLIKPGKLLPPRQVAMLVRKIAQALAEAHAHGVIHRDLKPANIMLDQRNEPVVMDFGLARQMKTAEDARLTQDGAILGTPVYMAPEQVRGELNLVGPTSDIYALGVILYQFLTGELPFNGPIMAVFAQVLTEQPKRPSELRVDVDPTLEAICLKMMAIEIDQRHGSMKEVATELAEFLKSGSTSGPQPAASVASEPLPVIVTDVPAIRSKARPRPKAADGMRWPNKRTTVIGGTAFAFLLLLGVIIIIRNRNGTETKIETDAEEVVMAVGTENADVTVKINPGEVSEENDVLKTGAQGAKSKTGFSGKTTNGYDFAFTGSHAGVPRDDNALKLKLCWCPQGGFLMGDAKVAATLTTGFWLGQTEITQGQWKAVMKTEPWENVVLMREKNDSPITHVGLSDALEFCRRLTSDEQQAGRVPIDCEYAIPTEAQWEYACRAGTTSRYSFGDDDTKLRDHAWFSENANGVEESYPHQVGQKLPNAWGLYDMHGNVWEWCRNDGPSTQSAGSNSGLPAQTGPFVFRGGGWNSTANTCKSSSRFVVKPDSEYNLVTGFRIALVQHVSDSWINATDRQVAEVLLKSGESTKPHDRKYEDSSIWVKVNNDYRLLYSVDQLPNGPCRVTGVGRGKQATNDDMRLIGKLRDLKELVVFESRAINDDGVVHLKDLTGLETLDLRGTSVTDRGIAALGNLVALTQFETDGVGITDASIDVVLRFTKLKTLGLDQSSTSHAGLKRLAALPRLEELGLVNSGVTDETLQSFKACPQLKRLYLRYNDLTDRGMQHLGQMDNVTFLQLMRTKITDDGLLHLKNLKKLTYLELDHTGISDLGLKHLEDLPLLKELHLAYTAVSDNGLPSLEKLSQLELLDLRNTFVSKQGVARLRSNLPKCTIVFAD